MKPRNFTAQVTDRATARRIAEKRAKTPGQIGGVSGAKYQLNTQWFGPGPQNADRLWMGVGVNQKPRSLGFVGAAGQCHRLGRSGCFIEQRAIGNIHCRQVNDHRLEIQDRFQPAL